MASLNTSWGPSTCSPTFCETMPDAKLPFMINSADFAIFDTSGQTFMYDPNDTDYAFPEENVQPIDGLRDYILALPFMQSNDVQQAIKDKTLKSMTVSVGAAKEKDLVGVINQAGITLFVWSRIKEDWKPTVTQLGDTGFTVNTTEGTTMATGRPLFMKDAWHVGRFSLAGTSNSSDPTYEAISQGQGCGPAHDAVNHFPTDEILAEYYNTDGSLNLDWSNMSNASVPKSDTQSWRRFSSWGCYSARCKYPASEQVLQINISGCGVNINQVKALADYCCYEQSEMTRPEPDLTENLIDMGANYYVVMTFPDL